VEVSRLESLDKEFARLLITAGPQQRHCAIQRVIEWLNQKHSWEIAADLEFLANGSMEMDRRNQLKERLTTAAEQEDELYFESEEAGEPESVWSPHFHLARAYSSIISLCEDNVCYEDFFYEAFHSVNNFRSILDELKVLLRPIGE
jgi:hypothetical protein